MERRRQGLRAYLSAVMADEECLDTAALREFVGLAATDKGGTKSEGTTEFGSTFTSLSMSSAFSLTEGSLYSEQSEGTTEFCSASFSISSAFTFPDRFLYTITEEH